MDKFHLTDPEPLEAFELDEYTDQEEISHALMEMLDRDLFVMPGLQHRSSGILSALRSKETAQILMDK